MRLLSQVIIKDFSEVNCFVLDLEDENDVFYKCTDVFAELIQYINKQDDFDTNKLFNFLKTKYPDVEDPTLINDVDSFIRFLREKKFLSE